jgi:hypothetical protein
MTFSLMKSVRFTSPFRPPSYLIATPPPCWSLNSNPTRTYLWCDLLSVLRDRLHEYLAILPMVPILCLYPFRDAEDTQKHYRSSDRDE